MGSLNIGKYFKENWEELLKLHFDKEQGSPYWLKKIENKNINPMKDFQDLEDFLMSPESLCNENDLKKYPLEYFIPKKTLKEELILPLTSSGSINPKKTIGWSEKTIKENAEYLALILKNNYKIEKSLSYLILGPSYPAPFQPVIYETVKLLHGILYFAPIETRGLKKYLFENPRLDFNDVFLKARFQPAIEYATEILSREKIDFISATFQLLPIFTNIKGFENVKYIYFGGMEINKDKYFRIREEFEKVGKKTLTSYGHFIFGLTFDLYEAPLTYYPAPFSLFLLTSFDDPFKLVKYGEEGRLRFFVATNTLLWSQVERDYGKRVSPAFGFDKDGIKEVKTTF